MKKRCRTEEKGKKTKPQNRINSFISVPIHKKKTKQKTFFSLKIRKESQ